MKIRNGHSSDYEKVNAVMNSWWERQVNHLQHELFFDYFTDTVFIAENIQGEIIGFINGFYSQIDSITAYVHFIGIDPNSRKLGIGKALYNKFFDKCLSDGRRIVRACTSKSNKTSVAFHEHLGFKSYEDNRGKIQFAKELS